MADKQEPDKPPKPQPPAPLTIRCPNCEEESLTYDKRERVWVCPACGYTETH